MFFGLYSDLYAQSRYRGHSLTCRDVKYTSADNTIRGIVPGATNIIEPDKMSQPTLQQPPAAIVGRLINLIPVGLKEAAIDSPTSRATIAHYIEQVDLLERWLEEYMKATNRLIAESSSLENVLSYFSSNATLPAQISESMLDHDYSLLAMKRYSEGAKDFWMSMVSVVKRMTALVIEPIRAFLHNEIRTFREIRRNLELTQKNFDSLQAKFASQGKSKEPSSLREDAFQLHEARRAYLKASMEFFTVVPQLRFSLDKLLVRIFSDQWTAMRNARENTSATFQKTSHEMDRVKGWIKEMEISERAFRNELTTARKQLEEAAELSQRPSRELEDYASANTRGHAHSASGVTLERDRSPKKTAARPGEKQGWLYLKTYTGKPTRTTWVRKWAFVRNGVFGWLVQGTRAGGVEESERIGVLLCSVRVASTEDRRFCFEIKTNKYTIILQAETQNELADWISAIDTAKKKAVDDPEATNDIPAPGELHLDPAFAVNSPPVPEFGTNVLSTLEPGADDSLERTNTLPIPNDNTSKESFDLPRASTTVEPPESRTRDRLLSKLDPHRKTSANPAAGGGIASLIAASHGSMPVGPSLPMVVNETEAKKSTFAIALRDMPPSSLAPSTLASSPAPTNLSKQAVISTGERGISATADKSGIPNGILANIWGSSQMGFVNRLERGDLKVAQEQRISARPSELAQPSGSPSRTTTTSLTRDLTGVSAMSTLDLASVPAVSRTPSPGRAHRNTISLEGEEAQITRKNAPYFPNYYPLQLKTQDAQFRLLFPSVKRDERLVLVFRATWNPNDQQEFPGRVYVTSEEIYFYSNHLGLVLTSGVSLASIDEVTAAPGKDCDFLFLHMRDGLLEKPTRITIKVFLEPLRLLQKRLNFLVRNSRDDEQLSLEEIIKTLLRMESDVTERSPSVESWEEIAPDTPIDGNGSRSRARASTSGGTDLKAPIRVDRALGTYGLGGSSPTSKVAKFRLPAQPVLYTPPGNLRLAAERQYDVSPKALFHVLFGDKSAVWQLLQHQRRAQNLKQGPWVNMGEGRLRRDFDFTIPSSDLLGRATNAEVHDYQVVDVNSDHLCYVVTDKRTAWHLPYRRGYRLVSKIVITHVAKAHCKLAIFVKVEWLRQPWLVQRIIEHHAMSDLELDALDLADLVSDQVRKLGARSRTKRAIQIFGQVGQSTEATQLEIDANAFNIEMRRMPVEHSLLGLMIEGLGTAAQSALGTLVEIVINIVRWLWKTCSANSVIIGVLLVSLLYNTWYTSRSGMEWYSERNAAKFMTRLGVGPNAVMSRAVHVSDLDELLSSQGVLPVAENSTCYRVFQEEYALEEWNPDFPKAMTSTSVGKVRTQKARHRLGTYRHDLLVAMRVVDSVERELVTSEWERWVEDEQRRCARVGHALKDGKQKNTNVQQLLGEGVKGKEVEVRKWYDDYCASCSRESEKLANV